MRRLVLAAVMFAWAVAVADAPAPAQTAPSPAPTQNPCEGILNLINRPTVASSPCAVPTKHVLVESGYANVVSSGAGTGVAANYPQALIRIGTFDPKFEFDVFAPNYTNAGDAPSGWGDLALGTAFNLGSDDKAVWGGGAIVSVPTGNSAFTAGAAQFTGDFNWVYNLSPVVGLFGTESFNALSARNASGAVQSYFAFIPSTGVSAQLSPNAVLYGEYTYYSQAGPGPGSKSLFDFGYEQAVGSHFEIDVEYGFAPPDPNGVKQRYFGAGLSFMN